MGIETFLFTLLGAVLYALLYRGRDITVLIKSEQQRNEQEQAAVEGGLLRSLLVEFLALIPASSLLFFLILPLFFKITRFGDTLQATLAGDFWLLLAFYVGAGMVSYNFPFVLVKEMATRITLNTLRESLDLQDPKKETKQIKSPQRQKKIESGTP